jgi:hypothetical protein
VRCAWLLRYQTCLDQCAQGPGNVVPPEAFGCQHVEALLADVIGSEHDGEQSGRRARQTAAGVGSVVGVNGSGDVVSATR